LDYIIIRSRRKTISIQVKDGQPILRAPKWLSDREILAFAAKNQDWTRRQIEKANTERAALAAVRRLTPEELRGLAQRAKAVIPARVAYYAPLVGVTYGRVAVRCQRTRWGSCGANGNLNFNCLLLLAPPEVLDSVVVHELCHRKVPNHSDAFYAEVLRVLPDYRERHRWLRENGKNLMAMADGGQTP